MKQKMRHRHGLWPPAYYSLRYRKVTLLGMEKTLPIGVMWEAAVGSFLKNGFGKTNTTKYYYTYFTTHIYLGDRVVVFVPEPWWMWKVFVLSFTQYHTVITLAKTFFFNPFMSLYVSICSVSLPLSLHVSLTPVSLSLPLFIWKKRVGESHSHSAQQFTVQS